MSDQSTAQHPTDPGPFQKYLFSGACYVQIGQCYASIKQAISEHANLADQEQLRLNLEDIWRTFVGQQFGTFSSLESAADTSHRQSQPLQSVRDFHRDIERLGSEATHDLLSTLQHLDAGQLDLQQFFLAWAKSCDQAYGVLVKSDVFAKAIGDVVNTMLRSAKT